ECVRLLGMRGAAKLDALQPVACRLGEWNEADLKASARHCERLHHRRHAMPEIACRRSALGRKLIGESEIRATRIFFGSSQSIRITALVERGKPGARRLRELSKRLGTHSILACHVEDCADALLDSPELGRIEIEAIPVGAQRPRGLFYSDARFLGEGDDFVERA